VKAADYHTQPVEFRNVPLAFGLVFMAGACTCLGASLIFCSKLANLRILAGALGTSAGVMTYISFVEIFSVKAIGEFMAAGLSENVAAQYATFCFFGGCLFTWLLDKLVHALMHLAEHLTARRVQRQLQKQARVLC